MDRATAKKGDANAQHSSPDTKAMHAQAIHEVRSRGLNSRNAKAFNLFKSNTKERRVSSQIARPPKNELSGMAN